MSWSEDRLHRWLARRPPVPGCRAPWGHDAALLEPGGELEAASCDQVVEGVHFEPGTPARAVGVKAARRALSDLAATAAEPRALLAALRAPASAAERDLRAMLAAVDREGRAWGAGLVGGDLACAPGPLSLAVTALGRVPRRPRPPHRSRGRAGDVLLLTGPVGGSLLGRHLRWRPRLAEGRWLARQGARALMDVSDGLAWDLFRLARSSGIRLVLERVPLHRDARRAARLDGRTALDHGLHDGEDHELVALCSPAAARRALRDAPVACPGLVRIGRAEPGHGLVLEHGRQRTRWDPSSGGWRHGS